MSFNATKCCVIHIAADKSRTREFTYCLHGQALNSVDHSKNLGATDYNNLPWNKHIQNVAAKGNSTLGFVEKRNLKECTSQVKAAGYCTLVHPSLEYADTVWDPHLQSQINSLEQIQRRAVRFVTKDYKSIAP